MRVRIDRERADCKPHTVQIHVTIACFAVLLQLLGCSSKGQTNETPAAAPTQPAFDVSPDGSKIVFVGSGSGVQDLYLLNLKTMRVSRVCDTSLYEMQPRFSPNGTRILFAAGPPNFRSPTHIYSCGLDGNHRQRLTDSATDYDDYPVGLDENGSRVGFARSTLRRTYSFGGYTSNDWDIWLADHKTANERRITYNKYYMIFSLDAAVDGSTLVFAGYRGDDAGNSLDTVVAEVQTKENSVEGSLPDHEIGSVGYAVFGKSRSTLYVISGPCTDTSSYSWEIDAVQHGQSQLRRVEVIKGLLDSIRYIAKGNCIYYLANPEPTATNNQFDIWKLELADQHTTLIADSTLFTKPMGYFAGRAK